MSRSAGRLAFANGSRIPSTAEEDFAEIHNARLRARTSRRYGLLEESGTPMNAFYQAPGGRSLGTARSMRLRIVRQHPAETGVRLGVGCPRRISPR